MKKRLIKTFLSFLTISIFIFLAIASADEGTSNTDDSVEKINVSVENVRIVKEYNNAWGVKGQIKNNTGQKIKGAVKIKFINSNGDIVHNNRAFVNDGDSFDSGQSANFEYFTDPSKFKDVVDFKVDFYER